MSKVAITNQFLPAILSVLLLVSFAGSEETAQPKPLTQGGIVLTFDDRNFNDWTRAIPLFDEFGVKATFFISGKMDESAREAIRQLREHGHAIGSHSVNHLKAVEYFQDNSPDEFIMQEISPQLVEFRTFDISPTSFAYPMSRNNRSTDESLLKVFRHIRTGKNIEDGERLRDVDAFFVPVEKISQQGCLIAKGIDYAPTRTDRTFEQIDEAMSRAVQNNEIIVFYAHRIADSGKGHHITPEALTRIIGKAKEMGLQFYTFDQLP